MIKEELLKMLEKVGKDVIIKVEVPEGKGTQTYHIIDMDYVDGGHICFLQVI